MTPATNSTFDQYLEFTEDDQWGGITSATVVPAPTPNLARVLMTFRTDDKAQRVALVLDSDTTEIVIQNANNWVFRVPPQYLSLKAGSYVWALKLIDDDNPATELTYAVGHINVLPNLSVRLQ